MCACGCLQVVEDDFREPFLSFHHGLWYLNSSNQAHVARTFTCSAVSLASDPITFVVAVVCVCFYICFLEREVFAFKIIFQAKIQSNELYNNIFLHLQLCCVSVHCPPPQPAFVSHVLFQLAPLRPAVKPQLQLSYYMYSISYLPYDVFLAFQFCDLQTHPYQETYAHIQACNFTFRFCI